LLFEQLLQSLPKFVFKQFGEVCEQVLHGLKLLPGFGEFPFQLALAFLVLVP
jgi:hypothetical protein